MAGTEGHIGDGLNGITEDQVNRNVIGDHVVDDEIHDPNQCIPECVMNDADSIKMIACDNEQCTREWFHIECVNLTLDTIPAESVPWLCPGCSVKPKVIKDKKKAAAKYDLEAAAQLGIRTRMLPDLPPSTRSKLDPTSLEAMEALLPGGWRGRGRPVKRGEPNQELLDLRRRQAELEVQIAKAKVEKSKAELAGIQRSPAPSGRIRSSQDYDMMKVKEVLQAILVGEESDDDDGFNNLRTSMESDGKLLARKKLRSGLYRKAADEVVVPQRWPHLSLRNEYRSMNMAFNDLSLPLFVAGELEIISQASDPSEQTGRLQVLTSLMYDASSPKHELSDVLKCYAAWVREIELGTYKWGDDSFMKVFANIIKRTGSASKAQSGFTGGSKQAATYIPHKWFCTLFNRNKCDQASPHMSQIKGYGLREVSHICGTCYLQDKVEATHAECSSSCPHYGSREYEYLGGR